MFVGMLLWQAGICSLQAGKYGHSQFGVYQYVQYIGLICYDDLSIRHYAVWFRLFGLHLQVIPLTVVSSLSQGVRILTVVECIRLVNDTSGQLSVCSVAVCSWDGDHHSSECRPESLCVDVSSQTLEAVPLLFWNILSGVDISRKQVDFTFYLAFSTAVDGVQQNPWHVSDLV